MTMIKNVVLNQIVRIQKKEVICENNEQTTEYLDEENSFNIINKRLINIILNKIKIKENGIAFCKSINE